MAGEKKYSYIKKSFAKNSFICLGLSVLGLCLFGGVFALSVSEMGQSGLTAGALGFSSIAGALLSLWFCLLSFREENKNLLLAKIGGALAGLLLLTWSGILIAGFTA